MRRPGRSTRCAKAFRAPDAARPCVAAVALALLPLTLSPAARADTPLNSYGNPGYIDMPAATPPPDAEIGATFYTFGDTRRTSFAFQAAPRLGATLRYNTVLNWNSDGIDTWYGTAFDLRVLLFGGSAGMPDITLGFQDILGTGLSSGEYLVASKALAHGVTVTGGLGWGVFGQTATLPGWGTREPLSDDARPRPGNWFKGPIGVFAGANWQATDRLGFRVEYSSSTYAEETARGLADIASQINAAVDYRITDGVRLGAYTLGGSEFGLSAQLTFNPKSSVSGGSRERAPVPVKPRAPGPWSTAWASGADTAAIEQAVAAALAPEGIIVEGMRLSADTAELRVRNLRYEAESEALGRTARLLTHALPASVESFVLIPVENGIPVSSVALRRADIERFENAPDGTAAIYAAAVIGEPPRALPPLLPDAYPRFTWSLDPYVYLPFLDSTDPLQGEIGLRLRGQWQPRPGIVVSASVIDGIVGSVTVDEPPKSNLPRVRSDYYIYQDQGNPAVESLTAAWYANPGRAFYTRVTAGYLERMYGGVSGEVLWKPVSSRLALGAEVSHVRKRAYDGGFGFRDYSVTTGFGSVYYDFGNGLLTQVSAGRYLAGDWGATVSVDRVFGNGWQVGAFATLTDQSWDDFGDGAFDKGIRVTIPFAWFTGRPTRNTTDITLRPFLRDAGQQVDVAGRLYETVRGAQAQGLAEDWGRFWR